jgi:dextranase
MALEVWPSRATFGIGEPVSLIVSPPASVTVTVTQLGQIVHKGDSTDIGVVPPGGYAVEAATGAEIAHTAFDVLDSPLQRPRYGFLTDFRPSRTGADAAITGLLRNHLNLVQFYDWMYRHAELIGTEDTFEDALGRPLSHSTTRDLVGRVREAGALPLAYAAVYGAGAEYAQGHHDQLLYHADGTPWTLADFLWIANLAAERGWRDHIIGQFTTALDAVDFAGLHLDQYGAPKLAYDADGKAVDLADQFPDFIGAVRAALPDAALVFNNVNDYPTWATARAPQDVTYIEVWSPHTTYAHLARLIDAARGYAPERPVILAAYLEPFGGGDPQRALWSARLALATIFAHGGHSLLLGEGDGVLVDPYYPNFARLDAAAAGVLRAYFDFAVATGDVLYDPTAVDITTSHAGGINDDVEVAASVDPVPGQLWVRVRRGRAGMAIHLIDLTAQTETRWNEGKRPGGPVTGVRVRVRHPQGTDVLVGGPELGGPALRPVASTMDGDHVVFELPPFTAWVVAYLPASGH